MSSETNRDASQSDTLSAGGADARPAAPSQTDSIGNAQLEPAGAPGGRSGEISSSMSADAALAALHEASALVDAVGAAARAMTEGVSSGSSEAAVISAAVVAAVQPVVLPGASPVGQAEEAVDAGASDPEADDLDDWDEEDELGWAIGSELEFLDADSDDWDGPVGDGLDEEEGQGGIAVSKDPAADKAAIDAAANAGEDEVEVQED